MVTAQEAATISTIPASAIQPGQNDRQTFNAHDISELAMSINLHGLAQPITVRPIPGNRYEIVAGERRFRAITQVLKHEFVPCLIRDLDDRAAADIMLIENIQRTDLNPMDEANAYAARVKRFAMGVPEIAATASVSESRVRSRMRLTLLVPEAQQLISTGNLGLGFGDAMADLDVNRQRIALRALNASAKPTLQWFKRLCGEMLAEQAQTSMFDMALFMQQTQADVDATAEGLPIPMDDSLPEVDGGTSVTDVLSKYLTKLLASDDPKHRAAALVVGRVFDGLIRCNCARPRTLA